VDTSGGSSSHQTLLETNEKLTRRHQPAVRRPSSSPTAKYALAHAQIFNQRPFHPFAEAEQRFHPPSPGGQANRIITTRASIEPIVDSIRFDSASQPFALNIR
tara:strand:+ start:284 stop:592 length:309 start_codon:yes stop_codon:yes gene_type:complete